MKRIYLAGIGASLFALIAATLGTSILLVPATEAATPCVSASVPVPAHAATTKSPSGVGDVADANLGTLGVMQNEDGQPTWDGADRGNDVATFTADGNNYAVIAGIFETYVHNGAVESRHNIVVVNTATGVPTDFAPVVNGPILTVRVSCSGTALYIGGNFSRVNGEVRNNMAKLNLDDGSLYAFDPAPNCAVNDIDLVGTRVVAGGCFTSIGGAARDQIASLNATTGVATAWLNLRLRGSDPVDPRLVFNVVTSPDQSFIVVTGNFYTVNGVDHKRVFVLNAGAKQATLSAWYAKRLNNACSPNKAHEELGVDIAPSSKAFYTVTTGGNFATSNCDAIAKWDARALTKNRTRLLWINFTADPTGSGDSLSGVESTSRSVFVAGHNRHCSQTAGLPVDSVERSGLCEFDAKTGALTNWYATSSRQRSMHSRMVLTPNGLLIVGDANKFNDMPRNDVAQYSFES